MLFILLGCVGIINPNAAALSVAPFNKNAGSAASLFGLLQWSIAGLSSGAVSLFKSRTTIPLAGIMAATAILSLLVLSIGKGTTKQQSLLPLKKFQMVH